MVEMITGCHVDTGQMVGKWREGKGGDQPRNGNLVPF